ncbi:hypothetical protein C5F52_14495 [Limnohabitans sp. TS-CS-82]|nr:hypothetical protein C5F52_14495 [Limnohabitans sp. TS-CS-82]
MASHLQFRTPPFSFHDALYPNLVHYFGRTLEAHVLWLANHAFSKQERKTFLEIGVEMRFNQEASRQDLSKTTAERLLGRNIFDAHVKRYVSQAQKIIKNVENEHFPVSTRQKKES